MAYTSSSIQIYGLHTPDLLSCKWSSIVWWFTFSNFRAKSALHPVIEKSIGLWPFTIQGGGLSVQSKRIVLSPYISCLPAY